MSKDEPVLHDDGDIQNLSTEQLMSLADFLIESEDKKTEVHRAWHDIKEMKRRDGR